MKKELLTVKELAAELRMSVKSIQRGYRKGEIPVQWLCRMARFDLAKVRRAMERNGRSRMRRLNGNSDSAERDRRPRPAARTAEKPPFGKTGAEFPRFHTEGCMSAWTCSLGWFRFTVSDSTADEVIARVGGEWIKDKKGFLGYRQGWLSRGHAGGLGRIGTAASWAPREVHVDLSQELISDENQG